MQDKTTNSSISSSISTTNTPVTNVERVQNLLVNLDDGKPVEFLEIKSDKTKEIFVIESSYPLYPLVKLLDQLQNLFNQPEYYNLLIDDTKAWMITEVINQAYQNSYKAIVESEKWVVKREEDVTRFYAALELITNVMQEYFFSNEKHLVHLCEVYLKLVKLCHKHIDARTMRANVNQICENHISGAMEMLMVGYMRLKNYQLGETYANKLLVLYDTLKNKDQANMAKRYCDAKGMLGVVYLEYGHLENAIKMLEESVSFLKKPKIDNFNELIVHNLAKESFKIADKCNKNAYYLGVLKVYQIFKLTKEACKQRIYLLNAEEKKAFAEYEGKIEGIFKESKVKYLESLSTVINGSSDAKAVLETLKPNILGGYLTLTLKETVQLPCLKSILGKRGISVEKITDQQLKVDLYQCIPEILKNSCEDTIVFLKKEQEKREREKEIQKRIANTQSIPAEKPSTKTFFSTPTPEKPSQEEDEDKDKKKPAKREKSGIDFWSEPDADTSKKSVDVKNYHWKNSDLTYCSSDENQGKVKMFGEQDDLWFGYIPDALKMHPLYEQWNNKLKIGATDYDSIRYIAKELENLNQNFSSTYPYKFKIVISNHRERLYGWVDDCYVDAKGKHHYLICFGYAENKHKLLYLPQPEILKRKFEKEKENSNEDEKSKKMQLRPGQACT